MIGVAEQDVRPARAHVGGLDRLDRRGGADRHERGRADLAAPHRDRAGARAAVGRVDGEGEAGTATHWRGGGALPFLPRWPSSPNTVARTVMSSARVSVPSLFVSKRLNAASNVAAISAAVIRLS